GRGWWSPTPAARSMPSRTCSGPATARPAPGRARPGRRPPGDPTRRENGAGRPGQPGRPAPRPGALYFGTWGAEGSRTRRDPVTVSGGGITFGEVVPVR